MQLSSPTELLRLRDDHGAPVAEYLYHPEHELMYVRWHGQLTGTEIIRAVQQGVQWRNRFQVTRLLNDKTDTGGDWSDALPWLQYEWLPLARGMGLQAVAYVFSPDRENQFATQKFVAALRPHLPIELFEHVPDATAWLISQGA